MNTKKIFLSLSIIVGVAALAYGGTQSFFSDTETSTGNTFTAGEIDLKIDNESYVTSTSTGQLVLNENTSWTLRDLTIEKFFDFDDIKPGDIGEDTISIHVDNNDSWLCAAVTLTSDNENNRNTPEIKDGDLTDDPNGGELADQVNFLWWADDGDNVLESNETTLPGGPIGALGVGDVATVPLADSGTNIWGDQGPLPGGSERFIGKGWCFGAITLTPVAQDALGKTGNNGPLARGTGFSCNGSQVDNTAQSDSLTADVTFTAVQSRNNSDYLCVPRQEEPTTGQLTVTKVVNNGQSATTTVVADFPLFVDATSVLSGVANIFNAGAHTVSETNQPGYTTSFGAECPGGVINVPGGGSASCTITNTITECADGIDNGDEDLLIDTEDPGCHTDGNPTNPASYDPNIPSESLS